MAGILFYILRLGSWAMGMALCVMYYAHVPFLAAAFYEVYPLGSVFYQKVLYIW